MKITATYEDTEENMMFFAKQSGWTEEVDNPDKYNPPEGVNVEDIPDKVPNPVSMVEFIQQVAQNKLVAILAQPVSNYIRNETRNAERDQIAAKRAEIESGLNIQVQ